MREQQTDDADRFRPLRRRFLSLGVGEIVAAAVFAVVPFRLPFIAADDAEAALWFALFPLLFILIQGGVYWLLARHHLPEVIPRTIARIYQGLRVFDSGLLVASAVGIIIMWPGISLSSFVIAFVWVFAVAEYINYFQIRLSYPWQSWARQVSRWSTPRLVRDLRRAV